MATSQYSAQDLITCKLCGNPAMRFCNNCFVDLCVDCVSKHVDELESLSHEIAPFHEKKVQLVVSECETHSGRKCEAFCHQCQTPVCTKCLVGPHKGHDAMDIMSFAENKKKEIKRETDKIGEKIQFYLTTSSDIQRKLLKASTEYANVEQELERLRKIWHIEVDAIFDEFISLTNCKKDYDLGLLTANQAFVQKLIQDLIQMVHNNKEVLQSNKASDITNYTCSKIQYDETKRHIDFDATIPSLISNTIQGKELCVDFGELEATLTRTPYVSASSEFQRVINK